MKRSKRVIPGFGLTLGITMSYVGFFVLLPMISLVLQTADLSLKEIISTTTDAKVFSSYKVSFGCSLLAALINSVFGTMLAWVIVRYRFPGRSIIDGLIELPFALPTAVAGIALTFLTANKGWVGKPLSYLGISVAYTKVGIVVALVFITLPFVVRSIQPILEELSPDYEEAGRTLGAGSFTIFWKIIFPEIKPALLTGFALAFARGLGEYGSVIFIAGNKPFKTEIAPLIIVTKLEEFLYGQATAVALVMLLASFIIMFIVNRIQIRVARLVGD